MKKREVKRRVTAFAAAGVLLLSALLPTGAAYAEDGMLEGNLLSNPTFTEGTSYWYATGNASLEASVDSETGVTYATISGRDANWNCVAQDITGIVENNTDYAFSFDVRLHEDYGEGRTVQLCTTKKDSNDESEVYDRLTMTGGTTLANPGEWTRVSGVLSVAYTGTLEKLEFKISEQGAALADGSFGAYDVKQVSLVKKEKEKLEIEWDIKDLKQQFAESFGGKAGVAIPASALLDEARMELVTKHFNSITAENEMKPDSILGAEPTIGEDGYPVCSFQSADEILNAVLDYNTQHPDAPIQVRGHVLVWHSQTPEWFFHEGYDVNAPYVSADVMLARMENYISQVLDHFHGEGSQYRGLIYAWDVVNEAVDDGTGGLRTDSSWYRVFGDDTFIRKAFVYANKYAPAEVKLFYNDYNETTPQKRDGICQLLRTIQVEPDARIDGMGMQAHYNMESPSIGQFEQAILAYSQIVDEIQLTELDMKASADYDGSNQTLEYTRQAYRYKALFDKIVELNAREGVTITAVTLWGTHDGASWLQNSNTAGGGTDGNKPQCPLFFDDNLKAKPAYWALVDPSRLEPAIQEITIIQSLSKKADMADAVSYSVSGTDVRFYPYWDEEGIHVQVHVTDDQAQDTDGVIVYFDRTNQRADGADIEKYSISRAEGTEEEGGYEVTVDIPMQQVAAAQKVGMDVVVVNNDIRCAYNDLRNTQETSSRFYASATCKPCMEIKEGTVLVDGIEETVWEKAVPVPFTIAVGTIDVTAEAKLLWDKDYLYVYAKVKDPCLNADAADAYQQDSMEVFVDENYHRSDSYEADDKQYRINYLNEHSFNGTNCKEENIESASAVTEEGYIIEAAFRWTEIEPQVGARIGLELQINDANQSGSRAGTLSWYDESGMGWSAPSVFGTAVLVSGTSEEQPGGGDLGDNGNTGDNGKPTDDENTGDNGKPADDGNAGNSGTEGNTGTSGNTGGQDSNESQNKNVSGEIITGNKDSGNVKETTYKDASGRMMRKFTVGKVEISGSDQVLTAGMNVKAQMSEVGSEYERAKSAAAKLKKCEGFRVVEVNLWDANGKEVHELSEAVTVSMPMPSGLFAEAGKQICVYRIAENGKLVKCSTTVKDGTLSFETNHFSTFLVVKQEVGEGAPQTSDPLGTQILISMFLAVYGAWMLRRVKQKRHI